MGDYSLYKALKSYSSSEDRALCIKKDDVLQIQIQSPIPDPMYHREGMLFAYNRRTQEEGYVPGTASLS